MNIFYKKTQLDLDVIAFIIAEREIINKEKKENISFTKNDKKNIKNEFLKDLENLDYVILGKKENGIMSGELCLRDEKNDQNYRITFNEVAILLSLKEKNYDYK